MNVTDPAERAERSLGDPLVCSKRVQSIESVEQSEGRFFAKTGSAGERLRVARFEKAAKAALLGDDLVIVSLSFLFRASPEEDKQDADAESTPPVAEVQATFTVRYRISKGEAIADADLQAFGEINGRLNLVPYWREYLHDCLSRAGLPPYLEPPFNAAKRIAALREKRA